MTRSQCIAKLKRVIKATKKYSKDTTIDINDESITTYNDNFSGDTILGFEDNSVFPGCCGIFTPFEFYSENHFSDEQKALALHIIALDAEEAMIMCTDSQRNGIFYNCAPYLEEMGWTVQDNIPTTDRKSKIRLFTYIKKR